MPAGDLNKWRTPSVLVVIFVLLFAGIVAAGCLYYRNYERHFRAEAERQLSAVAELKVNELAQYRKERLWDADALFKNAAFSGLVRRFFEHPEDGETQQQFQEWAAKYLATRQYDLICLFDAQGVIRMAVPAEPPISSFVSQNVSEILRSDRVIFQDFTRNEHDQRPYLALLVPVLDTSDANHPLGVFALRIDPETYLYPFLRRWPTPSLTAETLLVRREGNDALFLNELKFQTNTALHLRISLENTNVPAVKAVLGEKGVVEGWDYRKVPTLAALHAIPDSPWFLVARMNAAEVYAPLGERLRLTLLLVSLLLISTALGIGTIWWHRRIRFYQERSKVAGALRESEERFRLVFEEGPTGMAMLDETFHFIQVNPAFAAMLGYSGEELQTMAFPDITHPDHVQNDVEQVRRLLHGELTVYRTEKRYIAKSGKELWGQAHVSVVRNAEGAFRYFLAIINDIAERKRAEEALRRQSLVIDQTSNTIAITDLEGIITDVNAAQCRALGRTREELVGKSVVEAYGGNPARNAVQREIIETTRTRGEWFGEVTNVSATGKEVIVECHMWLLQDEQGKAIGMFGVGTDITGRKRAEEELRNSQALYYSLVENMPQSVFRKDRDGRFQFVNEQFCRDLERSLGDIVGRTDADIFPPELAQAYRKDDLRIMETGQALDQEEKHVGADGRELFVQVVKTPLRDARGQIIGVQGVFWDITARKRAEEALKENQRQLAEANDRLRLVMDTIPARIFWKNKDLVYLGCNRLFAEDAGRKSPEEIIGETDYNLGWREQAELYRKDDLEVMRSGNSKLNYEEPQTAPDGKPIWLRTSKVPLRDVNNRIVGILGTYEDITERKQAEEALHREQTLMATLMENVPDAVYFKDAASRFLRVNRAHSRKFGLSDPAQLVGKSDAEFFSGEHSRQALADEREIIRTGQPLLNVEEKETWLDGTVSWVLTTKLPLRDAAGQIIGTCGLSRDITERKQAEETLAHERQLLRTLIDLLPETFYIKDLDGRFLVANDALARQWGKASPSQLLGLSDWDLFPAGLAGKYREEDLKVLAGEPLIGRESVCVFADGREHTVLTTKLPFRDSQGLICGLVGIGHDITERKQATQRIADELTFNRTVLHASPVGIVVFKASGPCVSANETIAQITGGPCEEVLKQNFRQLESWKSSGMLATAEAALAAQAERRLETQINTTFGRKAWFSCSFTPFHYEGEPHLLVIITDITGRKRAEEALSRSEATLRSLFRAAPVGISILKNRVIESINTFWCESFGYPAQSVVGKPSRMFYQSDEEYDRVGQALYGQLHEHGVASVETKIRRSDGVLRDVILTAAPLRAEDMTAGNVVVVHDVTERKRAEEALRESEAELRTILESTADGILAVDSKGKVIKANQRFADLWRIPQSLMAGGDDRALLDFVMNQLSDPEAFIKSVQSLYGTDAVDMNTLFFKDGRVFERFSFPMMVDGAVLGRVWSFRDITERKRQERELSEKNSELERFTYTVSHDLKSPLVTVKTYLGYLEQDLLAPNAERVKQDVTYMHTAADKMDHLLDELLNLARVGRRSNPSVRVTFQELAREAVGLVAGHISTSRVEVQVADAVVVLECDRSRLVEIWQNLLENACKFMGDQLKPRIEIGVERRGGETVFFVRDNGVGIEPRYQEKVFSLFEKLNPKIEGTGMGLALVKRVVELYKGRIWVESDGPGRGANFLFTLPAAVIIEAGIITK
jgi:PAS domain S-box-containing protein